MVMVGSCSAEISEYGLVLATPMEMRSTFGCW